jgi:iron complex outermembrane receptor protein
VGDLDYRLPTANGGAFFMGGAVSYRTSVDAYVGGSKLAIPDNGVNRWSRSIPFKIDGYALVDARLGYDFPGDRVTASVWGKNIFNKYHVQNVISYNDIITQSTGMPSTYGVSLKVRWK